MKDNKKGVVAAEIITFFQRNKKSILTQRKNFVSMFNNINLE